VELRVKFDPVVWRTAHRGVPLRASSVSHAHLSVRL
jgi:hypothetical protein